MDFTAARSATANSPTSSTAWCSWWVPGSDFRAFPATFPAPSKTGNLLREIFFESVLLCPCCPWVTGCLAGWCAVPEWGMFHWADEQFVFLVLQLKAFLFAKKLLLAQLILVSKCTMQCRIQMASASSVVKINWSKMAFLESSNCTFTAATYI